MSGPGRVFIVDDDQLLLLIVDGILRAEGYATEVFDRPQALLARLSPNDRGCVVIDLQMPGMNGLALQKALGERGVHLPIVFVGEGADSPDVEAAKTQGALGFLKKPIVPSMLRAMIAHALKQDASSAARSYVVQIGVHRLEVDDDTIMIRAEHEVTLEDARRSHEVAKRVYAEHGYLYQIIDATRGRAPSPEVRKRMAETSKDIECTVVIINAGALMRAAATLLLGALYAISGRKRPIVFVKNEIEARAWIENHRAERARRHLGARAPRQAGPLTSATERHKGAIQ